VVEFVAVFLVEIGVGEYEEMRCFRANYALPQSGILLVS